MIVFMLFCLGTLQKSDTEALEKVQKRAIKILPALKHLTILIV